MTDAQITQAGGEIVADPGAAAQTTQVGGEVVLASQAPAVQATQVGLEAPIDPASPGAQITQVGGELVIRPAPAVTLLDVTQVGYEAVVFAPITRFGNASLSLSRATTRSGTAFVRIAGSGEHERLGNAALRLQFAAAGGGLALPNPSVAPIVSVTHTPLSTVPPGTYEVSYTWTDLYGETQISPLTTVVVTGSNGTLNVEIPVAPPTGASGYRLYVTPTDLAAIPPPAPGTDDPIQVTIPISTTAGDAGTFPTAGLVPDVTSVPIDALPVALGGRPAPKRNTTGLGGRVFDHDFRDPTAQVGGTLGWRPSNPQAQVVVVRSGEKDVATLFDTGPMGTDIPSTDHNTVMMSGLPATGGVTGSAAGGALGSPQGWLNERWSGLVEDVPPTGVYTEVTSVPGPALAPDNGGSIPGGIYKVGYTLVDAAGHESTLSAQTPTYTDPDNFRIFDSSPLFDVHVDTKHSPTIEVRPSGGGQFNLTLQLPPNQADTSTAAVGFNVYVSQPDGDVLTRQNTSLVVPVGTDQQIVYTMNDAPTSSGPEPPTTSSWVIPLAGGGTAAGVGSSGNWYDQAYIPAIGDAVDALAGDAWMYAYGGFRRPDVQDTGEGLAYYNPDWRALPSAAILSPPFLQTGGSASNGGKSLYVRHVWTSPSGGVDDDGLLTLRFSGAMVAVYINGTQVGGASEAAYWQTCEYTIPAALLVTGQNVLAFQLTTTWPDASTGGAPGAASGIVQTTTPSAGGHVTGLQVGPLVTGGDLPNPLLGARRPDGKTRQYWQSGVLSSLGGGFTPGTGVPGFLSWVASNDDGPGFWGYYGNTHQPEFNVLASSFGQGVTPDVIDRGVAGALGPNHWPPDNAGFPTGYVYTSGPFSFGIGDATEEVDISRFSMISVGQIGGGGNVTYTLALESSDEWGPGAAFLLTYPVIGSSGAIERTAWNDVVVVDATFPVDADPWDGGRVVTTVPVNNPSQVFISAVSRDPTIGNLGMARMWVNWLDADQQFGGRLCFDNQFLHSTFGHQPATLWPYSENLFWTGTYFGDGAWNTAKYLQVVLFNHQATPDQHSAWLINITVREVVKLARQGAQWA